jgi:hypothetical protein
MLAGGVQAVDDLSVSHAHNPGDARVPRKNRSGAAGWASQPAVLDRRPRAGQDDGGWRMERVRALFARTSSWCRDYHCKTKS